MGLLPLPESSSLSSLTTTAAPAAPNTPSAIKPNGAAPILMPPAMAPVTLNAEPLAICPISLASSASKLTPSWVIMVCPTNSPPASMGVSKMAIH